MPWRALTLRVDRASAEAFSDALLEAGAQSVAFEPEGAMLAILALEQDAEGVVTRAAHAAGIAPPRYATERLEDEDWVRKTQAQFPPMVIGARLWVGPSWHSPPEDRIAVCIDPGLAFGTGTHPSTRLVLEWLERTIRGGERVLDYGCGSGILAISAAKLGAVQVDAVDIDPQSVATANANAKANDVKLEATLPDALRGEHYDVVVSNILAQPLILLAPLLADRGRRVALSGILEEQAEEVARAYRPWLDMAIAAREERWVLLEGKR